MKLLKCNMHKLFLGIARVFATWGHFLAFGLAVWMFLLFMQAYMSPEKAVVLFINVFGEARLEFYMLTMAMSIIGFSFIYEHIVTPEIDADVIVDGKAFSNVYTLGVTNDKGEDVLSKVWGRFSGKKVTVIIKVKEE